MSLNIHSFQCLAPRQLCIMLSSSSMLMANCMTGREVWSSTEDYAQGRPLSETDSNALAKTLLQNIHAILYLKGTAISPSNISGRLRKEFGQRSHKLARKSHLKPVKKKRLDFVIRHRHWTLAEWNKGFVF